MKPRKRIYVGCEGESKRSYVRWLQSRLDEFGLHLHLDTFVAGGGDPLAVVEACVSECKRRERQFGRYKKRAILLDSDKIGLTQDRDVKIGPLIQAATIQSIFQVFEHEALLLRHFEGQHRKRPAKGRSLVALRKVWPTYQKPADAQSLGKFISVDGLKSAMQSETELRTFLLGIGFKA